jgi:hypothetical protein
MLEQGSCENRNRRRKYVQGASGLEKSEGIQKIALCETKIHTVSEKAEGELCIRRVKYVKTQG